MSIIDRASQSQRRGLLPGWKIIFDIKVSFQGRVRDQPSSKVMLFAPDCFGPQAVTIGRERAVAMWLRGLVTSTFSLYL